MMASVLSDGSSQLVKNVLIGDMIMKKDVKNSIMSHTKLSNDINYALFTTIMDNLEKIQKNLGRMQPEQIAKHVYEVTFINFHMLYWEEKMERKRLEKQAIERVGQIDKLERANRELRIENEHYKRVNIQETSAEETEGHLPREDMVGDGGDSRQQEGSTRRTGVPTRPFPHTGVQAFDKGTSEATNQDARMDS